MRTTELDWRQNQAALLGAPFARTTRSGRGEVSSNRATVTTAGRTACRERSERPRSAPSRILSMSRRGSGAFPISSQRWHHITSPTATLNSTIALHGLDNQSAPASSTNISVPSLHLNAARQLILPVSDAGSTAHLPERPVVTRTTQPACQPAVAANAVCRTLDPNV
jgi:hypothetical protein